MNFTTNDLQNAGFKETNPFLFDAIFFRFRLLASNTHNHSLFV